MDIALCTTTGRQDLNDLLRGLVVLFETVFPSRIRSYYLGGSASDGTAVGRDNSPNSSDVDLFVIFKGIIQPNEAATFKHLVGACHLISPIQIDAHAYSEDDLVQSPRAEATQTRFLIALINVAGLLVYGEDLRAELPEIPFTGYVLDVIESGLFHLGIPRQKDQLAYPLPTPLVPPLTYPDATGEFYGYDVVPARSDAPRGARVLVAITAWIVTLILALETGRYAGQKSQSLQLAKAYLPDDPRVQLAATIYDTCKGQWGYALPENAEDRARLRDLCRQTLDLENDYLRLCHDYLLTQMQQSDPPEQRQAARILQSVVYCDEDMLTALRALVHSCDESVRTRAEQALTIAERHA